MLKRRETICHNDSGDGRNTELPARYFLTYTGKHVRRKSRLTT